MGTFARQVQAIRDGDTIRLRMLRNAAARQTAIDPRQSMLDQVLAAAASGLLRPAFAAQTIAASPALRQAVIDLAGAQTGDVTIGNVAGGDIVELHIHLDARASDVDEDDR